MALVTWEQANVVYQRLGYHFWPTQELVLKDRDHFFLFFAGGVGAGKSLTGARYLLPELLPPASMFGTESRHYWIVGPDYKLTHPEFEYLVQAIAELGLSYEAGPNTPQDGEWYFKLKNGVDVCTKSGGRPESLHSLPVDGILAVEAGQIGDHVAINRIMPRLLRTKGKPGWCLFTGTFEGNNTWMTQKFWEALDGKLPDWAAYAMPSWENLDDFPGGREDVKIKMAEELMTYEEFMQRFGAVPATPSGVVLKEFSDRYHVTERASFDPSYPVQIWVDPGRTYAVLAVQIVEDIVRVIDEVYLYDGETEKAIKEAVTRPWWTNVRGGWIDVEAPEARTTWQNGAIWKGLTTPDGSPLRGIALNSQRVGIEEGIERLRTLLHSKIYKEPCTEPIWTYNGVQGISRIIVHPQCINLRKEAALYCYPKDRLIEGNKPLDRWNHAVKALAYGCVGVFGYQSPWMYSCQGMLRRPVYGVTR